MRFKKVLKFLVIVSTLFSIAFSLAVFVHAVSDVDFSQLSTPTLEHTAVSEKVALLFPSETEPTLAETVAPTEPSIPEETVPIETTLPAKETTPTETVETILDEPLEEETDPNLVIFKEREYYIPFISLNNEPMVSESGYVEKITEVPHYIQQYYEDVPYGNYGTVSDHGCGIACLAMVYSYLLDEEILPDELATKYGRYNTSCGSSYNLFNDTASDFNLVIEKMTWDWNDVYSALLNGQVVIANPKNPSVFTDGGHFIVLAGLTEDGKIIVRDPSIYNYGVYTIDVLKEGFKNGFNPISIKNNGFPCWIYQPKDIEAVAARAETNVD